MDTTAANQQSRRASAAANRSGLPRCDGITSRAQSGLVDEVPSSSSWRVLQKSLELRLFHGLAVPVKQASSFSSRQIVESCHMLHDIYVGNLGYR